MSFRPRRLRSLPTPGSGTPWRQAEWCAVDLELTGLDPAHDEIIAIGAVPVRDGRVVLGEALYTLVAATRRSSPSAVVVHKLRQVDLAGAPELPEALEQLCEALRHRVPVFHTAAIETAFVGRALADAGLRLSPAADTEALGRAWLRQSGRVAPDRLSLSALSRALGQPAEAPHHALADALATAQAFLALAHHLDHAEPQTVGRLLRPPGAVRGGGRFAAR